MGRVLAYSSTPLNELTAHAAAFADPACVAVLDLSTADSKVMPTAFAVGTTLGFRARVRPVRRTGKTRDGGGGKERDAYDESAETGAGRSACYIEWAAQQLQAGGARLDSAQLDAFTMTRLLTRDRSGERSRRDAPLGPDATVKGSLTVTDTAAFGTFLQRGIGRFRAFGFGMLLLSPSGPPRD